jgi:hypothetical protein
VGYPARQIPQDYPSQKPKEIGPRLPPEPPEKPYKAILVLVIAGSLVLVVAYVYLPTEIALPIDVTAINITSGDDACGTNGISDTGFDVGLGASINWSLGIEDFSARPSCTIQTITVTTVGFSISGANTPLVVPYGTWQSLSSTILAPHHSYTGALTVDLE